MKLQSLLLSLALLVPLAAPAQTLRWAAQGDVQTLDPHSQNEILTNMVNGQIYETLVRRDRQLRAVPGLATEWKQVSPLLWRLKLRQGVRFHDGTPLTAEDVVFSLQRANDANSLLRVYAAPVGKVKKIDATTLEFQLDRPNPLFLDHLVQLWIMSKPWAEKHKVVRPLNFKEREESYAALHANGTGPFVLAERQPGIKTVLRRNPAWWDQAAGNVQEAQLIPIANDATRNAALISGEVDLVLDPAPRDLARLRQTPGIKLAEGLENRLIYIGMDQARDTLLHGKAPGGKNPFKDQRVRRALYQAIDIEAIKTKLMNGQSAPTGGLTPSPLGSFNDPQLEARLPHDLAAAQKLMLEAGYAEGFEVLLDCPNNRYVNDEEICIALAAMWKKLKVAVKVNAQPRALLFPKLEKQDTSLFLYGWGGAITDAETMLTPVLRGRGEQGVGYANFGGWKHEKADALAAASSIEADPAKREGLIRAALREYREALPILPLHRQTAPWAMRAKVTAQHRADNWLELNWVTVSP
ncbi:ABC transporter substrate-binding protein [Pelomonas sp. SE-A7]|uniref:ABC transporter substrate-binding protein n=1 Tax=Pelomonas sp. SE-A7 TaxID=3054953 RepID=UPI00259C8BB3|nr:ABC transporter substrate-binding protein [Pelomonas sp. SE-A7]MDM4765479.1 ABC transporter substrate-binding protein [Pelomonas sp. SE-A7]